MLILTRRVGETLMIGDEVTVTVLGVKGNQVRIGINAPKDVSVHREQQREKLRDIAIDEITCDVCGMTYGQDSHDLCRDCYSH